MFVLAGRPLLTGNSCLWKTRVKCGGLMQPELENRVFSSRSKATRGGGSVRPWVLGRGKTLAVIPPLAESRLASGGSPLVSRREGKCESGDLRSQIKGDVGVILKFFYTHTQECASSSSSGIVSKSGSFVVDCTYSLTNYYYQITQILPFEPQKKQRKTKSNFSCGRQTKLERDQRALQSCSFPSPRKVSEVTVSPKLAS